MSRILKAGDKFAQSSVAPLSSISVTAVDEDSADARSRQAQPSAGADRDGAQSVDNWLAHAPASSGSVWAEAELGTGDRERHTLETTIAELRQELRRAQDDGDAREEAAYERGLREGRDTASQDSGRREELLAASLDQMRQEFTSGLLQAEQLAVQLSKAALSKIFGESEERAALVTDTLRHHLAQLQQELALAILVSSEDFGSRENLAALAEDFPGLTVEHGDGLSSGECMVRLKLGTLDLGLPGQWLRLAEFLDRLCDGETPS